MFQCKDLLTLPSMAKARIIAGKSGLSNRIRWVYKPENMNFAKWVKGQELLIISTPVIQSKDFDLHFTENSRHVHEKYGAGKRISCRKFSV